MLIKSWWRDWPNETAATIWKSKTVPIPVEESARWESVSTLPMGVFYCLLINGGMICEEKESFIYIRISY